MARRSQYEIHYARIEALLQRPLTELQPEDVIRLKAGAFMDLVCEVLLPCDETGATVLSMCHYFLQNGDLCQDPEMTVRLFPPGSTTFLELTPSTALKHGRAEALTFQQSIPPIYQQVYPEPGSYSPRLRRDLNTFLGQWLFNLDEQGHQPS
jgi:uncharacterized protein YqiB (DUF1249 family)